MKEAEAIIFDMDGTLYTFPEGKTFGQSPFGQAIQQNVKEFIGKEFGLNEEEATQRYKELYARFDGEMSLGLERDFRIDRMRFFDTTWDINPKKFIIPANGLRDQLEKIDAERIILSAAPRVWVTKALSYMGIADLFNDRIFTGEPDIRKPNPEAFRQVARKLGIEADCMVSIGDQEFSDILPAKQIGMQTVRIGDGKTAADIVACDIIDAVVQLRERKVI